MKICKINKQRRNFLGRLVKSTGVVFAWLCAPSFLNAGNVSFKSKNQSSETLFMSDNGRVGIGTKNPGEKLEVVGTINATTGKLAESGNALVPAGCIQMYGGSTVPGGWLLCNGAAISRTTYASLYAAIGTIYGAGNGSTTFNLPDFRGIFPRGAGTSGQLTNANSTAFSGILGAYQNDKVQGHRHAQMNSYSPTNWYGGTNNTGILDGYTGSALKPFIGNPITDGTNGTPRTGAETNPANLAVNFIIKY